VSLVQVPLERWDIERLFSPDLAAGKMYTRLGAWLTAIDQFDGAMFGMNHSEAVATDPQVWCCRVACLQACPWAPKPRSPGFADQRQAKQDFMTLQCILGL
jgi:hypothetical protein